MEKVLEKLKKLREIEPDKSYALESKGIILASPIHNKTLPYLPLTLIFGSCLILFLVILFYPSAPTVASLDKDILEKEIGNLGLTIQLAEIEYHQEIDDVISLALKEISNENNEEVSD